MIKQTKYDVGYAREIVAKICFEIRQGIHLIEGISDGIFTAGSENGSLGGHFRHNLEFINLLLEGIDEGKIDYSARIRDRRIEESRSYCIERMIEAIKALGGLSPDCLDSEMLVRSEVSPGLWLRSSFARELEFIHSHTVHHYALVTEKVKACGIGPPAGFGVAPSTLEFRRSGADYY